MKCTWLCVWCGSSILHSGRAGGGETWAGLAYRSCSNASVRLTVYRGKVHLLPGIAVIRAWRYETASAYDRRHNDRATTRSRTRGLFPNENVNVCLSQVCIRSLGPVIILR